MSHRISSIGWIVLFIALGFITVAFAQDKSDKKETKFVAHAAQAGMAEVKLS